MWEISKSFNLSYGHRLHNQNVDSELSCEATNKCRFLHGHEATVTINLKSSELDETGMVLDFANLNWFKEEFIDKYIDHKFILDKNDPIIPFMFKPVPRFYDTVHRHIAYCFDASTTRDKAEEEYWESFLFVDFMPTSENLSKWVFDEVSERLKEIAENFEKPFAKRIRPKRNEPQLILPKIDVSSVEWKHTYNTSYQKE